MIRVYVVKLRTQSMWGTALLHAMAVASLPTVAFAPQNIIPSSNMLSRVFPSGQPGVKILGTLGPEKHAYRIAVLWQVPVSMPSWWPLYITCFYFPPLLQVHWSNFNSNSDIFLAHHLCMCSCVYVYGWGIHVCQSEVGIGWVSFLIALTDWVSLSG